MTDSRLRPELRCVLLSFAATVSLAGAAAGQSVVDRSPNLSSGWVGAPGTVQFNFLHRFSVSGSPSKKVGNSPTFLLGYSFKLPLLIAVNYATNSDVAPQFPNEYELFARAMSFRQDHGAPLDLGLQVGYNNAAASADAEVSGARRFGPVKLTAVGRYLSNGYHADSARFAAGGGAVLRLHRNVALAADAVTLLDRLTGEDVAWSAALQLAIPSTPHSISLQVTNTTTGTLQGTSRGTGSIRGGFEFTIPITLSRYFGHRADTSSATRNVTPSAPDDPNHLRVEMRNIVFSQQTVELTVGQGIAWTNNDPLDHTVTADDGSFNSGPIHPGETWRHVFDRAGTYAIHCTPHPFMKATIVVH